MFWCVLVNSYFAGVRYGVFDAVMISILEPVFKGRARRGGLGTEANVSKKFKRLARGFGRTKREPPKLLSVDFEWFKGCRTEPSIWIGDLVQSQVEVYVALLALNVGEQDSVFKYLSRK